MGGSGFAIDMIRRVRANRALRKEKVNRYRKNSLLLKKSTKSKVRGNVGRSFKQYTEQERQILREGIRCSRQKEGIRSWTYTIILTIFLSGIIYWLIKTIIKVVG